MLYLSTYEPISREEDRETEHRLGRTLLQNELRELYGRNFDVCEEDGRKPYLKDSSNVFFNISHTKGLVVCGISDKEIGVDAEWIRGYDERLMKRICSEEEISYILSDFNEALQKERFFRLWTLKESYIKAIGEGLAFPMKQICFSFEKLKEMRQTSLGEQYGEKIIASIPGWGFKQFRVCNKYIVAVCEATEDR